MICPKCKKIKNFFVSLSDSEKSILGLDTKEVCDECYHEIEKRRDIRTLDDLQDKEILYSLNPSQLVKNFVEYFAQYQKEPSAKILDILWRLFSFACHEDHTASAAMGAIMDWQKFKFVTEFSRWES